MKLENSSPRRYPPGAARGERRRASGYDPASDTNYRPTGNFQPKNAKRLLDWCNTTNLSVAGLLDILVERLPIDPDTGLPVGIALKAEIGGQRAA